MVDFPQAKSALNLTHQAISATQQLRTTVTNVFEYLKDGITGDESRFLQKFQELLQAVNKDFTELEKLGESMTSMPELSISPLGPAGQLSMEGNADENTLFESALKAYQWYTKLHSKTQIAQSIFFTYKRSMSTSATSLARSRRTGISHIPQTLKPHSFPSQQVESYLRNTLPRHFQDLSIKMVYAKGSTRIIHITVPNVFFALILFRNLLIEKIIVRGLDEDVYTDAGCPDMFTRSRYECMRQISDHATSALLYVDQFTQIDLKPRFILAWSQTYKTLFSDSCHKCGKILNGGVPPTWRDFKTHAPYHSACK